ncbi:alpha/beta fold hydrolase [bacterium]|nr:MAG: alpha/beta fold hydrolase [bacterium]
MIDLAHRRVALSTGIELDCWSAGAGEPIIFLHGFPESHRTWRHQLADLARDHLVIAPDQRGYARSDKPPHVEDYAVEHLVADVMALADAYDVGRFTLAAHDWGGAVGWVTALTRPDRVARLVIANAPHPLVFQRSLIEDEAQRAASQYIRAFRTPGIEHVAAADLDIFFDETFAPLVDDPALLAPERATYLDQWSQPGAVTAMLNWYRAMSITVPAPGEPADFPAWTTRPFPPVLPPTLVIWGLHDKALLPTQLDALAPHVRDLTVAAIDAGHFVPWEAPGEVTAAMRAFLNTRPLA